LLQLFIGHISTKTAISELLAKNSDEVANNYES